MSYLMRKSRIWLLAALGAAVLALVLPGDAAAASPKTLYKYYGTVASVADGDTIWVDLNKEDEDVYVRLYGINTPDEHTDCWGPEADLRLTEILPVGTRVKVKGDIEDTPDAFGRIAFRVWNRDTGQEVAKVLLEEGYGLPMPSSELKGKVNKAYRRKAGIAQDAGIRIWDPESCGTGPDQNQPLSLRVMWDADGSDDANRAGEWVEVRNDGDETVDLDGWQLRDASEHVFDFPNSSMSVLGPGESVRVVGGTGSGGGVLHWGNTNEIFSQVGDGAYLFDPDRDIRAYLEFPCKFECSDPLTGKVQVTAVYDGPGQGPESEWIDILNISDDPVDLFDYHLWDDGHVFHFAESLALPPGQIVRVHVGTGSDSGFDLYWGKIQTLLQDSGDKVLLRGMDGRVVTRYKWPCTPCGPIADIHIEFVKYRDDPGQEWLDIRNRTGENQPMAGWSVRNKDTMYFFDDEFVLAAGDRVRLFVGMGTDGGSKLYWGESGGTLNNTIDHLEIYTPFQDVADCSGWGGSPCDRFNPMEVEIDVDYQGPTPNDESFELHNTGDSAIDLERFKLTYKGYVFIFPDFTLGSDDTVTVFVGSGTDTPTKLYIGEPANIISSSGEAFLYDAEDGALVASVDW